MKDKFEKYIQEKANENPEKLSRKSEIYNNIEASTTLQKQTIWKSILKYAAIFSALLGISFVILLQINKTHLQAKYYSTVCKSQQDTHQVFIHKKQEYLQKLLHISEPDKQYLSVFFSELELLENEYKTYYQELAESESTIVCRDIEENEQMQLQVLSKIIIELQNKKHYDKEYKNSNS
jgi:transcriptional regulator with GAF, ATPase, and Fis domain